VEVQNCVNLAIFTEIAALHIEQCTTSPLFHNYEVSQGICNQPMKN